VAFVPLFHFRPSHLKKNFPVAQWTQIIALFTADSEKAEQKLKDAGPIQRQYIW
jgi:hypothetical protein